MRGVNHTVICCDLVEQFLQIFSCYIVLHASCYQYLEQSFELTKLLIEITWSPMGSIYYISHCIAWGGVCNKIVLKLLQLLDEIVKDAFHAVS